MGTGEQKHKLEHGKCVETWLKLRPPKSIRIRIEYVRPFGFLHPFSGNFRPLYGFHFCTYSVRTQYVFCKSSKKPIKSIKIIIKCKGKLLEIT